MPSKKKFTAIIGKYFISVHDTGLVQYRVYNKTYTGTRMASTKGVHKYLYIHLVKSHNPLKRRFDNVIQSHNNCTGGNTKRYRWDFRINSLTTMSIGDCETTACEPSWNRFYTFKPSFQCWRVPTRCDPLFGMWFAKRIRNNLNNFLFGRNCQIKSRILTRKH